MRAKLLEGCVGEAEQQLALQNALVIAKVVRIDYPLDWPDVITSLIQLLRQANQLNGLRLKRTMLVLLQIVKELSTARLRTSQTRLQSVTPEIVFILSEIYLDKVNFWTGFLNGNGEDEGGAIDSMENSLLAIKIMRRLLVAGYEYPNHSKDVCQLWEHSQQQFSSFLAMITHEPPILVSPAKDLVEKHLLQLSKLYMEMANGHPAAFALMPGTLDLVRATWGLVAKYDDFYGSESHDFSAKALRKDDSMKDERPILEKLSLKGLNILRACVRMVFSPLRTFKYRTPETKAEQEQATALIKTQLLTNDLVAQIASIMVTKFFVFRQVDLEAWEEEPDEWEIREEGGGDTWEFEIRPCSEKLFMDLVINYKDLLVQPLLSFFQSVTGNGQSSVVTKDAVYTAMGLSAPVVFESFDFDAFLRSTLVSDVQQTGPGYKVLRRRIAILLGQWITIKISEENRPLVYQIFQHLLKAEDETNDHVVRVTAARQFKAICDDFAFDAEKFLPYAPDILNKIMSLIQEVEETEQKMAILETVRLLAVRMEQHIAPFADQIVSILPALWEASGEEHLMKQAILTLFSTLETSMKTEAQRYSPLVLPLVRRAVEPGSEMQVYLLEEALDLWLTIIGQTPSPASPEMLELIESIFPLLEIGSDNLRAVLNIVDAYIMLAPEAMLGDAIRLRLLAAMTNLLGVTKRDLAGLVTTIVEKLIRYAESMGGANGITQIAHDLHACGYTRQIFEGLRDAWECHQTTGPGRKYPKLDDVVETDYFTILARLALADPSIFFNILSSVGNPDDVWRWLSTEWFHHFDSMANIERQKLSCLALTRLLELPPPMTPVILERLQDYFSMWTSVITEMIGGRDDGGDNLIWLSYKENEGFESSVEGVRRGEYAKSDPVHTVHTWNFVKERLSNVVRVCGGEEVFQREWLGNVDKDVLENYQGIGTHGDESNGFWEGQD